MCCNSKSEQLKVGESRSPLMSGNRLVPLFCFFLFLFLLPSLSFPSFPQTRSPEILTEDHFPCGWISQFCCLPLEVTFLPGTASSWFLPPSLCPRGDLLPLPTCPSSLVIVCVNGALTCQVAHQKQGNILTPPFSLSHPTPKKPPPGTGYQQLSFSFLFFNFFKKISSSLFLGYKCRWAWGYWKRSRLWSALFLAKS